MFVFFATLGDTASPEESAVQALVARARAGDREAARLLYRDHVARVFRAVRPLVRSEHEAEDVVQETFTKALSALSRYEPRANARFISWLLAIATNTAFKHARRFRFSTMAPAEIDAIRERQQRTSSDPAGEALDLARRRSALLTALAELPERERAIVSLRYGAELSVAEVAAIVRISEANVRKICERQRKRLVERIEAMLAKPPRPAHRAEERV
jgi:RNA polymerase sigma-70 factor, ECF subfamily